ncbi:MAG TPA: hypothetical protein VF429_04610 [Anaerolineae bacterium]|jgi:hypothetical protein
MQQQFDRREMMARAGEIAKEIRKSEAYPALIGGVAGGIAGAMIAALIASRASPRRADPIASDAKESRGGWALRDVVQLLTVGGTLLRQVQSWLKEQEQK